jgi:hypothetical protein
MHTPDRFEIVGPDLSDVWLAHGRIIQRRVRQRPLAGAGKTMAPERKSRLD